jgi:hypothetical protein
MKYIIFKQPIKNDYPLEILEELYYSSGYILASIEDSTANTFDWETYEAFEVSEAIAMGSLWSECIIKIGQTQRYLKWQPNDLGQKVPELSGFSSGSTGGFDGTDEDFGTATEAADAMKHVLSAADEDNGKSWNQLIMSLMVKDVFNKRFLALNLTENKLEESTWSVQLAEAVAYVADSSVSTPVLSILSAARGAEIADVATKVISANDAYNVKLAELLASQQVLEDRIKSTEDLDSSLLLKEDLFGIMVEAGLAIDSGRADSYQRAVEDDKYGVQF